MVEKKISWKFYLMTFIITVIIFTSGIIFGVFLSKAKVTELQESVSELEKRRLDQELNLLLVESLPNKTCDIINYEVEKVIPELNELAGEVVFYEDTKKFDEDKYQETKKSYMTSQIKYWLYLEKLKNSCNVNVTNIIYFYSNKDCDLCRNQGIVLSYMKDIRESDLMVFSLDTDMELDSIDIIKKSYGVKELPSLIINGKLYSGFVGKDELENILNQTQVSL